MMKLTRLCSSCGTKASSPTHVSRGMSKIVQTSKPWWTGSYRLGLKELKQAALPPPSKPFALLLNVKLVNIVRYVTVLFLSTRIQ